MYRYIPCESCSQFDSLPLASFSATSTQGVISEEHKAKQALGGVQLVRFSFPTDMELEKWNAACDATLAAAYAPVPVRSAPFFVVGALALAAFSIFRSRR